MKTIEGQISAEGLDIAIVASRFNSFIVDRLVEGALDCLRRHGVQEDRLTLVRVPGAFEIPLAAKLLADKKEIDAVVCLGAVIRGSTTHYDYVCSEVSKGIAHVSLESRKPVIFGVLTTEN
nr:6,7-dimethyl-8-ribityllumazine synthase [Treponemataceae bacterium]